jgi:hypothetical protein
MPILLTLNILLISNYSAEDAMVGQAMVDESTAEGFACMDSAIF